jgi:hypothetical protein
MLRFVILIVLLLSFAAHAQPLLELRCDGDQTEVAADTSGNEHNARVVGAERVPGRIGMGWRLDDKADCLIVPYSESLSLTDGPFTISCWFKPAADGYTRQGTYELMGTGADRGPGWRLYITWGGVVFRSGEGYGEGKTFWQINSDPKREDIFAGQWNHIAVTRDEQGIARLYLNGQLSDQSDEPFAITPARSDLSIGSYRFGYAYPFPGVLDELVITDRAMSARQIFERAILGQ